MILPWFFKLSISYRNFAHFYRDFLTTLYIRLQPHGITNYSIGPHRASSDPNGAPRFKMDRKPKNITLKAYDYSVMFSFSSDVFTLHVSSSVIWPLQRIGIWRFEAATGTIIIITIHSHVASTRMPSGTNDVLDINDVVLLARRPRSSADWCWPKFQSQQTHRPCSQHKTRCWQETYQQKHMQAEHTTQAKWQHASANMNVSYVQTYGECYYYTA